MANFSVKKIPPIVLIGGAAAAAYYFFRKNKRATAPAQTQEPVTTPAPAQPKPQTNEWDALTAGIGAAAGLIGKYIDKNPSGQQSGVTRGTTEPDYSSSDDYFAELDAELDDMGVWDDCWDDDCY